MGPVWARGAPINYKSSCTHSEWGLGPAHPAVEPPVPAWVSMALSSWARTWTMPTSRLPNTSLLHRLNWPLHAFLLGSCQGPAKPCGHHPLLLSPRTPAPSPRLSEEGQGGASGWPPAHTPTMADCVPGQVRVGCLADPQPTPWLTHPPWLPVPPGGSSLTAVAASLPGPVSRCPPTRCPHHCPQHLCFQEDLQPGAGLSPSVY